MVLIKSDTVFGKNKNIYKKNHGAQFHLKIFVTMREQQQHATVFSLSLSPSDDQKPLVSAPTLSQRQDLKNYLHFAK